MNCKKIFCMLTAVSLLVSFAGCVGNTGGGTSSGNASDADSAGTSSAETEDKIISDMFTERDIEVGYDENTDTVITLSDGATEGGGDDGVAVSGDTVTLTKAGTYILKGTLSDGSIVVDADKSDKLHIVLAGVNIAKNSTAPFYVKSADKVFVTLAPDTENTLTNTGEFTAIDDNNIDACIFAKDDITFNGTGSLTVASETGHGIVCKDTLCFTGGTYTVKSERHALSAKDDIRVMDGSFVLSAGKDGLNADNDEDDTLGFIYIEGGDFDITAGDDGMHAGSSLRIVGGNVTVVKSYEGLEGQTVEISGGNIEVTSSDDGINAAGDGTSSNPMAKDENAHVRISGGTVHIDAEGDGIDSNGDLYILGGKITVCGPTSGGDGALDYGEGATAQITGGTVFAFGSAGMAENFNSAENQGAALVSLSGNAGDTVSVKNGDGETLASAKSDKKYECVAVSCPGMTENGSFTLTNGSSEETFTLDGFIYGDSGGFGGMGAFGGKGGFGGKSDGRGGEPFGEFEPPEGENGEPPELPSGESFTDKDGNSVTRPNGEIPQKTEKGST